MVPFKPLALVIRLYGARLGGAKGHENYTRQMGDSYAGCYAGYIDHGNSAGRDLKRYYGGNAARIATIEKKRDPHNLFRLFAKKYLERTIPHCHYQLKSFSFPEQPLVEASFIITKCFPLLILVLPYK